MPALVVTDLDGTLWDHEGVLHDSTKAALDELSSRGVAVLAATARNPYGTRLLLERYDVKIPAVMLNGALGREWSGETFHRNAFTPEDALDVVAHFRRFGISPHLVVDHPRLTVVRDSQSSSCRSYQEYALAFSTVYDLEAATQEMSVLQVCVIGGERQTLEQAAAALRESSYGCCYLMEERTYADGDYTLLVGPEGADKWSGVEAYCRRHHLDSSDVVAIGDGLNDIAILEKAKTAIAMAHAPPVVKAAAHHVIAPDGNWAGALSYF